MFRRTWSAAFAAIGIVVCLVSGIPADAQSAGRGTVTGIVADRISGLAISDANVTLYQGPKSVATTKSDSRGQFTFKDVAPAIYTLLATANGYQPQSSNDIAVIVGQQSVTNFTLTPATTGDAGGLRTIATTRASAGNALASTTTISRNLDPALLSSESYIRFGDQLRTLPGVNLGGLSSSVGDDLYINIRGMGSSETQALLDGHPVGPIGVYAINGGSANYPTSFNFADSPAFALNKVDVTFGSGAGGLYGADAIGGTINMETLTPTATHHVELQYGYGDQGKQLALAKATGTVGRLGYALAGGVTGTYGMFGPQNITQTALPDNAGNPCPAVATQYDLTPCHYAANTYQVSQQTNLRAGLAKLTYALSPNTTLLGSWFASGQWADSTGNGDNDNKPYDYRLYELQQNGKPDCALPSDSGGAVSGYSVTTGAGTACYTSGQLASATYGPFGGGAGRARGTSMFDYHTRLQTIDNHSTYTVDYFFNHYKFFKTSEDAAGLNPDGTCCAGTVYSQFLNSQGFLVSDDIVNENSEIGFGYFSEHQQQTRLNFQFNGQGSYKYTTPMFPGFGSVFLKGSVNLTPEYSVYANLWAKRSSVDNITSFDPRVSFVVRPKTGHDVFRVTYGHTTGDPAAELVQGSAVVNANPSSLITGFKCNPYNAVGQGPNPAILPEAANDVELGYAHRFERDSSVQLNLYETSVKNQLFSAVLPLTQYSGNLPIDPSLLAGFNRDAFANGCNVDPNNASSVIPFLAISTTYNAASAIYKGVELTGRQRFTRNFYVDYSYDIQSAKQYGVSDQILQNNAFIINGAQIQGIPFNQATLGLDYSTPDGWQAHLDGYFVSTNNVSERPAYNFWSGFVGKSLTRGTTVRVGVFNIFNQATQNYGYIGHQLFIPENQFFHDTNSLQQALNVAGEEYGLASRSFIITLIQSL